VYDKAACVAYKDALDTHLGPDASAVVMSMSARDPQDWKDRFGLDKDAEEKLLARFNDPSDPLQILVVTAKLLTGFDAPILQTQYVDKPLRDHTLLQAITRTNRVYPPNKTHGLVVDYLGIFDDVAKALSFDDRSIQQAITNISQLREQLAPAIAAALSFFPGVDRTVGGYEGLIQAQAAIADDATKDAFAAAYSIVGQLWETLSPDPILTQHETDYRWLTDVYESVKPTDVTGRLVWHSLGAKTIDLINEHVTVEVPRTDLETIVLAPQVIEDLMSGRKSDVTIEELERQITARIARHLNNPKFVELGK
jgi:type I restriction enzyme, R subunit